MPHPRVLVLSFLVAAGAAGLAGGAEAAGICRADHLTCATTMPLGGYCECTAKGTTEGGTVMQRAVSRGRINATAGGCGALPNSPGCR